MKNRFTNATCSPNTVRRRTGFTLVELLVAIAIIGILAAIAIPAITRAVTMARQTAQKLEVDAIARATEQYLQKYGDYPPDGSNLDVLQRHMRKLFPRMAEPDQTLLLRITDDSAVNAAGTFSSVGMDRAEALVFFLGGFSASVQNPLTGPDGPLDRVSGTAGSTSLSDYQYNAERGNSLFDFDQSRLTIVRVSDSDPLLSNDEELVGNVSAGFGVGTGPARDPLPVYLAAKGKPTPLLYFDSRTYGPITPGAATLVFNGYNTGISDANLSFGGVRPYKTNVGVSPPTATTYATETNAFNAIKFHMPNSFQIISPGSDGIFGACLSTVSTSAGASPTAHFITETGQVVQPLASATAPSGLIFTSSMLGGKGFQDLGWNSAILVNGHLDNVTNFSTSTLESDLQ